MFANEDCNQCFEFQLKIQEKEKKIILLPFSSIEHDNFSMLALTYFFFSLICKKKKLMLVSS